MDREILWINKRTIHFSETKHSIDESLNSQKQKSNAIRCLLFKHLWFTYSFYIDGNNKLFCCCLPLFQSQFALLATNFHSPCHNKVVMKQICFIKQWLEYFNFNYRLSLIFHVKNKCFCYV